MVVFEIVVINSSKIFKRVHAQVITIKMEKKTISGIILTLLLTGTATLIFGIQPVRASGTIYIRADGSVEGTTHITSADNVTYTFTDNINESIVVERDNIIIDGNDYAIEGEGIGTGMNLTNRDNVTVSNTKIMNFEIGMDLSGASGNTVYHNNFINNTIQVYIESFENVWDDDYPSGGNYWSDHNPPDVYSGPDQNEAGSDGIGDTPYVIDENNTDRYPLIYPYGFIPTPDLSGDDFIDLDDIVIWAFAYQCQPGWPNWNPYADLNQDGIIDIFDGILIAVYYGQAYPPLP